MERPGGSNRLVQIYKREALTQVHYFLNNLFAPIVPNATFLYPLKTSEYLMVFFMFSGCRERVHWE